jgi:hypothetical protein
MASATAPDALHYFPPEERDAAAEMLAAWGVTSASLFSVVRHIGWTIDEPPRPARIGGGVVATVRYAGPLRWLGWIDTSFDPGDHASAFVEQGTWVRSRGLQTLGRLLAAQPFADPLDLDDTTLLEIVREVGRDAGSTNQHEVFGTFTALAETIHYIVGSHPLMELRNCFEPPHRI